MKIIKFLVVLILIVITYYSLKTPTGNNDLPMNDKIGHCLAYASLSFHLMLLSNSIKNKIFGLFFAICYSLLMEYLQGFIPNRTPSMYDMIANTTGVLVGFFIIYFFKPQIIKIYGFLRIIN